MRPKPQLRFFCLIITRMRPIYIMARLCTVRFLSAFRAVVALCKLPFALRRSQSQDVERTKETTKEKKRASVKNKRDKQRESVSRPLLLSCGRHEVRRRQEQWWFPPAPGPSAPAPCSSTHCRSSTSDTSLTASSLAGTRLPTSVELRKSSTA